MNLFGAAFQDDEHEPFYWPAENPVGAALLVHGFPGTPAEMRAIATILHKTGWTVQGILLPGFGPQLDTLPEKSRHDWNTAILNALRDIKRQHDTVLLVGFSLGGALAAQVAIIEPPTALILLAPFWKLEHPLWRMMPLLKRVLPAIPIFKIIRLDFSDPDVRANMLAIMPTADLDDPETQRSIRNFRLPMKLFAEIHQAGWEAYRAFPQMNRQTLVIQGKNDELVHPHLTDQMQKRAGEVVQYKIVAADHHLTDLHAPAWTEISQKILVFAALAKNQVVQ